MTSAELYRLIAEAHQAPEWACFPEVSDATGGRASRRADAVAMSLWPSRGLIVRGFEIKVSRSDWKREAADPAKAEAIARYCDEWWVVAAPGVVPEPELMPPAWGLMVPGGQGLRVVRKAERTEAQPLTRAFVAAVLRAADKHVAAALAGWVRREDIAAEIERARADGLASAPHELARVQQQRDRAQRELRDFCAETGLDLLEGGWNGRGKELGEHARLGAALSGRFGRNLPAALRSLEHAAEAIEKTRGELAEVLGEVAKR